MKKLIKYYLKYRLKFRPTYERKIVTVESVKEIATFSAYNDWRLINIVHFQDRKPIGGELKDYSTIYFEREVFISKEVIKEYYKI